MGCRWLLALPFEIRVDHDSSATEQYHGKENYVRPLSRDESSQNHDDSARDENPAAEPMRLFPYAIARQRPRRSEPNEPIWASARKEVADDDEKNSDPDWKHSLQVDGITQSGAEHDEMEAKEKEHQRDQD